MATDRFISGMGNKSTSRTTGTITRGGQNQTNLRARQGQFMFDNGTPVPAGTLYHMHPEKGPMEGAVHNPNIPGGQPGHRFLTPTNGNGRQTTRMNQPSPQRNMGRTSGYNQGGHVHSHKHYMMPSQGGNHVHTIPGGGNTSQAHGGTPGQPSYSGNIVNWQDGTHGHGSSTINPNPRMRMGRGRMKGELISLGNGNYRWNGNGPAPTIHIECTDAAGNNTMADCTPYSAEIGGQEGSSAGSAYGDTGGAHHYNLGEYHGCPQCPPGQNQHIHY